MLKKLLVLTGVLLVAAAVLAACGGQTTEEAPAPAPEQPTEASVPEPTEEPAMPELVGDSIRGAKLYDNWMSELGVDAPEGDQPLWATQSSNARSGKDTWRCKECHGWDYKGKDGAYGSGSHQTGFVGVAQLAGGDPYAALAALQGETNADHDFSAYMDEQALTDMALFISEEVIDTETVLSLTGDAANGQTLFEDNCVDCHGPEAVAINFHPDSSPEYPASIANENPLELLAKLRAGQPGVADMPSGIDNGWTEQEYADVIAYLQTLPESSPVLEGGRMYDNWIKALDLPVPETDMPLWATQSTNERSGKDTWRCKECHGWDYKGADGVYASGSHSTGFTGIFADSAMSAEELTAWLDGTNNADHDFSSFFAADDMGRMIAFIQEGMVDKSFVNEDKTVAGDADHGKALYNGVCASCHGEDGTAINFGDDAEPEVFGTIAVDNPWEFFNKASVGQPGEAMPAGWALGWTQQDIIDLIAYAQTLPTK